MNFCPTFWGKDPNLKEQRFQLGRENPQSRQTIWVVGFFGGFLPGTRGFLLGLGFLKP